MQLRYNPGAGDPVPYHDTKRAAMYYPGDHEVPREAAEEYLEDSGWEPNPETYGVAFDAAAFIDQHWQTIVDAIESGDVDDRLEDLRAAEKARTAGSGARPSVISAIGSRLGELTSPDADDDAEE